MSARIATIILAAGRGTRFGSRKHHIELAGRPAIAWSIEIARRLGNVVVVVPADEAEPSRWPVVVAGGETRSASVRAGLEAIPDDTEVILVHDAARPCATEQLYRRVALGVTVGADACVPVMPVVDSMRNAAGPIDRNGLLHVQTPQAFRPSVLRDVHRSCPAATDDASLVRDVTLVRGEAWNIKITHPGDELVADAVLRARTHRPVAFPDPTWSEIHATPDGQQLRARAKELRYL